MRRISDCSLRNWSAHAPWRRPACSWTQETVGQSTKKLPFSLTGTGQEAASPLSGDIVNENPSQRSLWMRCYTPHYIQEVQVPTCVLWSEGSISCECRLLASVQSLQILAVMADCLHPILRTIQQECPTTSGAYWIGQGLTLGGGATSVGHMPIPLWVQTSCIFICSQGFSFTPPTCIQIGMPSTENDCLLSLLCFHRDH